MDLGSDQSQRAYVAIPRKISGCWPDLRSTWAVTATGVLDAFRLIPSRSVIKGILISYKLQASSLTGPEGYYRIKKESRKYEYKRNKKR